MIGLMLAAALQTGQPALCPDVPGSDQLWARPEARFIVVGENHGTEELPAAFGSLVCEASLRGPVTVALEFPTTMQSQLDAFLAAPDEDSARQALAGTVFQQERFWDGRTSTAMVALLESVRILKAAGRDVAILAFQPSEPRPSDFIQAYYELDMAHLLARGAAARPESRVLVLVGNLHARKTPHPRFEELGIPAAGHLPATETISLNFAQQGGDAWNCGPTECGPRVLSASGDVELRGVVLRAQDDGAHDGVLAVGATTASPPFFQPD